MLEEKLIVPNQLPEECTVDVGGFDEKASRFNIFLKGSEVTGSTLSAETKDRPLKILPFELLIGAAAFFKDELLEDGSRKFPTFPPNRSFFHLNAKLAGRLLSNINLLPCYVERNRRLETFEKYKSQDVYPLTYEDSQENTTVKFEDYVQQEVRSKKQQILTVYYKMLYPEEKLINFSKLKDENTQKTPVQEALTSIKQKLLGNLNLHSSQSATSPTDNKLTPLELKQEKQKKQDAIHAVDKASKLTDIDKQLNFLLYHCITQCIEKQIIRLNAAEVEHKNDNLLHVRFSALKNIYRQEWREVFCEFIDKAILDHLLQYSRVLSKQKSEEKGSSEEKDLKVEPYRCLNDMRLPDKFQEALSAYLDKTEKSREPAGTLSNSDLLKSLHHSEALRAFRFMQMDLIAKARIESGAQYVAMSLALENAELPYPSLEPNCLWLGLRTAWNKLHDLLQAFILFVLKLLFLTMWTGGLAEESFYYLKEYSQYQEEKKNSNALSSLQNWVLLTWLLHYIVVFPAAVFTSTDDVPVPYFLIPMVLPSVLVLAEMIRIKYSGKWNSKFDDTLKEKWLAFFYPEMVEFAFSLLISPGFFLLANYVASPRSGWAALCYLLSYAPAIGGLTGTLFLQTPNPWRRTYANRLVLFTASAWFFGFYQAQISRMSDYWDMAKTYRAENNSNTDIAGYADRALRAAYPVFSNFYSGAGYTFLMGAIVFAAAWSMTTMIWDYHHDKHFEKTQNEKNRDAYADSIFELNKSKQLIKNHNLNFDGLAPSFVGTGITREMFNEIAEVKDSKFTAVSTAVSTVVDMPNSEDKPKQTSTPVNYFYLKCGFGLSLGALLIYGLASYYATVVEMGDFYSKTENSYTDQKYDESAATVETNYLGYGKYGWQWAFKDQLALPWVAIGAVILGGASLYRKWSFAREVALPHGFARVTDRNHLFSRAVKEHFVRKGEIKISDDRHLSPFQHGRR